MGEGQQGWRRPQGGTVGGDLRGHALSTPLRHGSVLETRLVDTAPL